jgi:NADP-dependent 3-hydroxy acid dehydrogenase YdfG
VALVTGAGSGIGRASAQALAGAGAAVILLGRRKANIREAVSEIESAEGRAIYAPCDVTERAQVAEAVKLGLDTFGHIDILVNSAGINTKRRGVSDIALEDWDRVIEVNLTGTFNCVRAVLPGMRERGDGVIVNIVSMAGKRASQIAGAAYCAAKHGQKSLTDSINLEENAHGIRATSISPGEVDTPIMLHRPDPVTQGRRARMMQPEDIAAAVLLVASLSPRAVVPEIDMVPRQIQ